MTQQPITIHRRALGVAQIDAVHLTALPPLSLYVHLPWCIKKCPYCDFNSHEHRGDDAAPFERYVEALIADLDASLPLIWGRTVQSVFFGGGTPSLLDPALMDSLLAAIRARLRLEPGAEITMEANPGTFERDRFRAYRAVGITRLSLGVQSFDNALLQAIGRVHDGEQARAAAQEASEVFDTFNLDLMYALPGQTVAMLHQDIDVALSFKPPHLSIYHLTLEPNTYFATHPPTLPDDDTASDMMDALVQRTATAGLQRYEVSAFAADKHRCVHNLNYWRFGDYLGLGAGAHGKLSFHDRVLRQTRWREPAAYMRNALGGQAVSNEQAVTPQDMPFEFMLNALRLRDGFALNLYTERTGQAWTPLTPAIEQAVQRGLLERIEGALDAQPAIRPTTRGFDFLSDLQQLFLKDTA
jgi:putative oxygen-independent coproporphyrinogen III oxidase